MENEKGKPTLTTLAEALEVSLDWLVGLTELDQPTLKRIEQVSRLPEDKRRQVYLLLDALLRDFKAREVYA
jgi:hypothetical protein